MSARPSRSVMALVAALAFLVGLAAWGAWASWRLAGDAPMSVHGWIAMAIAAAVTGLMTGGLMWLAFFSSRRGYDDDQDY